MAGGFGHFAAWGLFERGISFCRSLLGWHIGRLGRKLAWRTDCVINAVFERMRRGGVRGLFIYRPESWWM